MSLKESAKKKSKESASTELQSEIAKLKRDIEKQRREVAAANLRAEEAESLIRDFHNSNFEIPKQKRRKALKRGAKILVAFGDTHGCSLDPKCWAAFLADVEHLKPQNVIHGGDILDADGFLAQHHTTNYLAQTEYSYADEICASNQLLDQLQAVCPKSRIEIIQGNHDLRIETWALTTTQKHKADAKLLLDLVGPKTMLNLDKRGIEWHSRGDCHDDAVAGGTIKRGNCYFTHPQKRGGVNAARKMISSFKKNTVYFHVHRRDYATTSDVTGDEWGAWCPGCMCVKRKYWHHSDHFEHSQGYHLQIVSPDGDFLGINVPIINGKSLMTSMLKM